MFRKSLLLLVVLTMACQPANETAKPLRVALLTPGPITDAGWNAAAHDGLQAIKAAHDAEVRHLQTATPAEFERGFRSFASQNFDLVFGHGFEFQDAAALVSSDYPQTVFITTSGSTVRKNLAPMVFRLEQATYLLGALAAGMSQTGIIGVIGGVELPSVASTFLAFESGARDRRADIKVLSSYLGSWDDVSAAKEAAHAQFRQGADFILHNADAAGLGVFGAAQEVGNVFVFGSNKNQNGIAPDVVLASAVLDIPRCFLLVAAAVKKNEFVAKPMEFGMADDVVSLVLNPRLQSKIPSAIRASLGSLEQRIRDGSLEVPHLEF